MKSIRAFILCSAASVTTIGSVQAADLPLKEKPIEYVRVCSLYGAGFFYIPGADTCLKIGGYLRADLTVNGGVSGAPFWAGDAGVSDRYTNEYNDLARLAVTLDARTETEYGLVRTFGQFDSSFATEGAAGTINLSTTVQPLAIQGATTNNYAGNGFLTVEYAFIQFAGFTLGKSASAYNTPWQGFPGNNTAFLVGGYDTVTGINNAQYTFELGGGVSATVGIDDSSANDYNRTQILNAIPSNNIAAGLWGFYGGPTANITAAGTSYSGTMLPDLTGNVKYEGAWGLIQLSGALHDVSPGYWSTANDLGTDFTVGNALTGAMDQGHPNSKLGGAVSAALQIKNLPTGQGDDFKIEGSWSLGASKYVLGTSAPANAAFFMGKDGPIGAPGKLAIGGVSDAVYAGPAGPNQVPLQLTEGWGFRGAYSHNWDPHWSSSLFAGAAGLVYDAQAKAAWCKSYATNTSNFVAGPGYSCDPGFALGEIGLTTRWTPVKNLTFSSEVMYTYLHTDMRGQATGTLASAFPTRMSSLYQYTDQGKFSVEFRAQRNF